MFCNLGSLGSDGHLCRLDLDARSRSCNSAEVFVSCFLVFVFPAQLVVLLLFALVLEFFFCLKSWEQVDIAVAANRGVSKMHESLPAIYSVFGPKVWKRTWFD